MVSHTEKELSYQIIKSELRTVIDKQNNRPRKSLGYSTPREILIKLGDKRGVVLRFSTQERIKQVFRTIIAPKANIPQQTEKKEITMIPVKHVKELIDLVYFLGSMLSISILYICDKKLKN